MLRAIETIWYFERVFFPRKRLFLEALLNGQLEISIVMIGREIVSKKFPVTLYGSIKIGHGSKAGNTLRTAVGEKRTPVKEI